jgi:hypothetical protein
MCEPIQLPTSIPNHNKLSFKDVIQFDQRDSWINEGELIIPFKLMLHTKDPHTRPTLFTQLTDLGCQHLHTNSDVNTLFHYLKQVLYDNYTEFGYQLIHTLYPTLSFYAHTHKPDIQNQYYDEKLADTFNLYLHKPTRLIHQANTRDYLVNRITKAYLGSHIIDRSLTEYLNTLNYVLLIQQTNESKPGLGKVSIREG